MCYSFRTSLLSFTLAFLSGIYALSTGQYVLGMLILAYSLVQLSECMIWYGIDTGSELYNRMGTFLGKYSLPTHTIAIGLGILIGLHFHGHTLKWTNYVPLISGIVLFIVVVSCVYKKTDNALTYPSDPSCKDRSCQNNNNRLQWPYQTSWYAISFLLSILILTYYIYPKSSLMLIVLSFIITYVLFIHIFKQDNGSVWCFSAAVLAPVLVLINGYLIKDVKFFT